MTHLSPTEQAGMYRRAAQVIATGGLAKGSYVEPGGGHCTVGALGEASSCHIQLLPHLADVLGYTPQPCQCGSPDCDERNSAFNAVTTWNDLPGTTAQDVITLLETAAEKLEANQP